MSLIIENYLYLGSIVDACTPSILLDLKISHLINLTHQRIILNDEYKILHLPLNDSLNENLFDHFIQTNHFIRQCEKINGRCLVFCKYGRSRSVTIVLGYLIGQCGFKYRQAMEYLQNRYSRLNPNVNYLRQLKDYSNEMKEKNKENSSRSFLLFIDQQTKENLFKEK